MIRCIVKLGALSFTGLYPSTSSAIEHALVLYPTAPSISARPAR